MDGEKVKMMPNTLVEEMRLPEAQQWKAASEKELRSLEDLNVYTFFLRDDVPPGQKKMGRKETY